jgi:hypothetical protein
MKRLRRLSVVGFTLLTSCGPAHVEVLQELSFVGKTWLSTDSSAPLGTIRIFLPDGTLLMDSCVETYRLARWTSMNGTRIAWEEDTARIEADVTQAAADVLELRLHLRSEVKVERYRLAQVPFVCPDNR